jgi:protein-tyrosine-phosphatase
MQESEYRISEAAQGCVTDISEWQHGVAINHEAQQITEEHFKRFDYILGSDSANMAALERMKPVDATAKGELLP